MSTVSDFFDDFFVNDNKKWLEEAYETRNYTYPVGKHRVRILDRILSGYDLQGKKILDIGCGGGDISFLAASKGAVVTGIDMSPTMISTCKEKLAENYTDYKNNVRFYEENIRSLSRNVSDQKYDFIFAFGLIGYLESDNEFFDIIKDLINPNAHLIISCRNELFNMTSISDNTKREISTGNAVNLINEINDLYAKPLNLDKCKEFVSALGSAIESIENMGDMNIIDEHIPVEYEGTGEIQPRQSTPKGLEATANSYGLRKLNYFGVHPHLLLPRLNRKLPTQVFNILSDSLCVFEDDDIALIYSSVFIGDFLLG